MKPQFDKPPTTSFLPKHTYDPLRHSTQDLFWYHVEPHFNPVIKEDIDFLSKPNADLPSISSPSSRSVKSESETADPQLSSLLCFPLCHRLTAALLDEGKGHAHAVKPVRPALQPEDTWLGAPPCSLNQFNLVFEERVRIELQQVGLLDDDTTTPILSELRMQHWHLKNIIAHNNVMRDGISRKVTGQIAEQSARRERKLKDDQIEVKYLESMMEKGGKRGKGRFNKLLNHMHPNRHLLPGDPINGTNKFGFGVIGETTISKKRKRKSAASERTGHKNTEVNGTLPIDAADNLALAPQIADIIWKHNDQASIDLIVKECLERVPILLGDIKEARRKIANCISFSRKPFRFRKSADGLTYSATRV